MKTTFYFWIWTLFAVCTFPAFAQDLPDVLPKLEVTGLAICTDASKVRAIVNDRIVKVGDLFEVTDGKLGAKIIKGKRVEAAATLLEIGEIAENGVTVHYTESKTKYIETRTIPLKARGQQYGLRKKTPR